MLQKLSSVIDADGYYVDFVLSIGTDIKPEDGTSSIEWVVQHYVVKENESLIETNAPTIKFAYNVTGYIKPRWDGTQWVEGATDAEIAQWELDNPAPVVDEPPTEAEQLRADVDFLALMGGVTL